MFIGFFNSCKAQNSKPELKWEKFESSESGMKAEMPCQPKKYFKSFQDNPRPIHVYSFDCEVNGIKFLISSKNYMDDFDEKSFQKVFESNEFILKTQFGEIKEFTEKKDFLTNGFKSKYYEVIPKLGGKIKSLMVVNKTRAYSTWVGVIPEKAKEVENKNIDFEKIGNTFIKSFQILDEK